MKYKVPFIRPSFPSADELVEDYKKINDRNWFTNFGPFEREFAQKIGDYIGEDYYAATFSSATAGLMASILAVIGKGDESKYVVMPSFTFAAGAEALAWCGYKPLFLDIEIPSLQMDISAAKNLFKTKKNKIAGILFCNAFGVGATEIEAWESLARDTKCPLIIDSAAGFGSIYSPDRKVGSAGECEVFSFHATKPFAIGEGGAVVSKNKELIESVTSIQNFGFQNRTATRLGFNGKLQEINAAIGLRKFKTFNATLANRKSVIKKYMEEIDETRFTFQTNVENSSLCFATVIVKQPNSRDKYLKMLKDAGVDARTYYDPSLHKQEYFRKNKVFGPLENTEYIDDSVISLPIHDNMNPQDVSLIINTLNSA